MGKECLTQSHPWSLIHELFHFLILLHLLVLFLVILHPSGNIQMLSHTFLWGFDCMCSSSTGSWNLYKGPTADQCFFYCSSFRICFVCRAKIKVSAGLISSGGSRGESTFLLLPASRSCWHFLVPGHITPEILTF